MKKNLVTMKDKAKNLALKAAVTGTIMLNAFNMTAYADLESEIKNTVSDLTTKVVSGLAAIFVVAAIFTGVMAIHDMGNQDNPQSEAKGKKELTGAIASILAAAALIGFKGTIVTFISAAMS